MRALAGGGAGGPSLRTASRRQPFGRRARTRHGTGSIVASYDDTRGERAWAGRVGRGAAGRGEAEGSSKHRATSGEHMIRRLMRTSHDESARGGGRASRAQHAADVAKPPSALRRGGVSPEQLHVFENGRNYSTVITGADYCRAIMRWRKKDVDTCGEGERGSPDVHCKSETARLVSRIAIVACSTQGSI